MKAFHLNKFFWMAVLLCSGPVLPVLAATNTVNTLSDTGLYSLRYWLGNSAPGDTIIFSVTGTITLTSGNGTLRIDNDINIIGPGVTNLTITGNNLYRVFLVASGANVIVSGLTISNGRDAASDGVDLFVTCSGSPPNPLPPIYPVSGGVGRGGGIFTSGNLTLKDCLLKENTAFGGKGGSGISQAQYCTGITFSDSGAAGGNGSGGGIYVNNGGSLNLSGCTFANNSVQGGAGGVGDALISGAGHNGGSGGSVFGAAIYAAGTVIAVNCSFSGNQAVAGNGGDYAGAPSGGNGGNGGDARGGGIYIATGDGSTFYNCTISGNTASGGGSGQAISGTHGSTGSGFGGGLNAAIAGTVIVWNNILAGNAGATPDADGGFFSDGFNLLGKTNGSTGWIASDLTGSIATPLDALLGQLQYNGGATPTLMPLPGSPAIDRGGYFNQTTDQRGLFRPVDLSAYPNAASGNACDIGACELQATGVDIGLRAYDGTSIIKIAVEAGTSLSPFRITKNGTNYGVLLTSPSAPDASKFRIKTAAGTKSIQKIP